MSYYPKFLPDGAPKPFIPGADLIDNLDGFSADEIIRYFFPFEVRMICEKYFFSITPFSTTRYLKALFACRENYQHPFSVALYVHELTESVLFARQGYNFWETQDALSSYVNASKLFPEYHYTGILNQGKFLQKYAASRGLKLLLGTVVAGDPFSTAAEKDRLFAHYPELKVSDAELRAFYDFLEQFWQGMPQLRAVARHQRP